MPGSPSGEIAVAGPALSPVRGLGREVPHETRARQSALAGIATRWSALVALGDGASGAFCQNARKLFNVRSGSGRAASQAPAGVLRLALNLKRKNMKGERIILAGGTGFLGTLLAKS